MTLITPRILSETHQNAEYLSDLKMHNYVIVGLGVKDQKLGKYCDKNIVFSDDYGNVTQSYAKKVVKEADKLFGDICTVDPSKIVFLANEINLDTVASCVLVHQFIQTGDVEMTPEIARINTYTALKNSPWLCAQNIVSAFKSDNSIKALDDSLNHSLITPKDFNNVLTYIKTGKVNEEITTNYAREQRKVIFDVLRGRRKVAKRKGVAIVEGNERGREIGFVYAPVVIAVGKDNPSEVAIYQHDEGYVDMAKLKKKLALKEQGWHGNSLCLMSSDSTFELDKIEKAVNDCLSKEYMMVLDNQVDICQQIVLVNEQGNYDIYTNDDPSQTSVEMKTKVATLNKDDPLIKNLFIVKTTHSFIEKETSELGFVDDVTNDFGSVRLIVKKNRFDEIGAAMLQVTDCIGSTIVPIYFANENEKQKYFDAIDLTTENLMTLEEAYLVVAAEKEVQLRQNPRFQAMMLAIKGREA